MILDGQYPTTLDYIDQIKATDTIVALGITDPDLTASYQVGWVRWDNLPAVLHMSHFKIDNDSLVLEDVTRPENVDIILTSAANTSPASYIYYPSDIAHKNTWTTFDQAPNNSAQYQRFINKSDVNTILFKRVLLIILIGEDGQASTYYDPQVPIADIIDGTMSLSITYNDQTITITPADLDGSLKVVESGGHAIKYACISFGITSGTYSERPITPDGGYGGYYAPCPGFIVHSTNGDAFLIGGSRPYPLFDNYISGAGYRYNANTHVLSYTAADTWATVRNTDYLCGGFDGTIGADVVDVMPTYGMVYADGCNFFVSCHGRKDICMIRRAFAWDEIYKWAAMQMRYGTVQEYATNADKYYAKISPENEFLCEFANGADDLADLRPWQIAGVTLDAESNTYEPDQKPPYTPDEDDSQNVGASVLRPSTLGVGGTSGFITQYVLTAAEIATLGRTLWTSFVNPDYWRNFLFSLALDTGSFDMASLLDYFVSLRVYPFSLINVPSYAATGSPSIYIGSGIVPLTITGSTTLHTINNFADYIDAGSCVVHSAYFHDDFRDFSNVEIMLYLPYCGTVQLNPGDVVGGTLHAQYAIDFATGGCVAYVDLTSADGISYPIAVLPGSIGADVPLSATNAGQIAARFAGDVINFASTVSSNAESDLNARASAATGAITGGASGALSRASSGIGTIATGGINAGLQHASQALDMATRPAIGIPTLSGGRGFSSFGAPQTAYIQIRRGIYKRPQTYDHTVGSPSSASKTIGSLAGLVKGAVDTAGLSCTADEAAEVRTLIAAGIIV